MADSTDPTCVIIDISGGSSPVNPGTFAASISVNPDRVITGSGPASVTMTATSSTTGYTINSITNISASGLSITPNSITGSSGTISIPTTTAGTFTISADVHATRTADGVAATATAHTTFIVGNAASHTYYSGLSSVTDYTAFGETDATALTSATGVIASGQQFPFNNQSGQTQRWYLVTTQSINSIRNNLGFTLPLETPTRTITISGTSYNVYSTGGVIPNGLSNTFTVEVS